MIASPLLPFSGKPVPRKEGLAKVSGQARYIDDLLFPGIIYGATVRSHIPRGDIRSISFGEGIPWEEFAIVTAMDIPGENAIALILKDQPCLADTRINHAEEPVVLLAHHDRYLLQEARRSVSIEVDPLPPVLSIDESLNEKEIVWGEDNLLKVCELNKGNVDQAWSEADFIIEGEYETGAQEQLYIEPNGMVATADDDNGVTVWGSMQCPYYVQKALMALFGFSAERVRVIQAETGGGFGGKEEYPSMIAAHAALLAWKSRKPVKLIYDRAEDMVATTKRHPSRTRHRTAVSKDGKLLAMDIDFVIDGGAYATLSSVVLSRGTIHAAGPYSCPNVRIRSRAVATNTPPHGAFRGFGAPQSIFALERHLNRVAAFVGLTPEELRRRNFLEQGTTTATGQVIRDKIDLSALLDYALQQSGYHEKKRLFAQHNRMSSLKKGIGIAAFMHGAGFTGAGEKQLASVVGVEATEEGKVRILSASTEIGQGTNTIFAQMAADALNISLDYVEVAQPDTGTVPNSGPTVASRTCMIVGKLVESAALNLKQTLAGSGLLRADYSSEDFCEACAEYVRRWGPLKSMVQYLQPPEISWDEVAFQGDAYRDYAWAVYVAEVSVDLTTCEAQVDDFVAVQNVGQVIHPVMAAGQIEGGVAQGIGFALYEKVVWNDGRMLNHQMTNYIIPTSADVPPIRVFFVGSSNTREPKGLGELPMDGPAPAIVNAIEDAIGVSINRVPLMPEDLVKTVSAG